MGATTQALDYRLTGGSIDSATTTSTTSRGLVLGDHGSITVDPGPASGMRVAATARMSTPSLPPRPSLWITSPATDEGPLPGPTLLGNVHTYRRRDQVREEKQRIRECNCASEIAESSLTDTMTVSLCQCIVGLEQKC